MILLSKSLWDISPGLNKIKRTQKPASVMVLTAVYSEAKSPLIFIPEGVKINKEIYFAKGLEGGHKP